MSNLAFKFIGSENVSNSLNNNIANIELSDTTESSNSHKSSLYTTSNSTSRSSYAIKRLRVRTETPYSSESNQKEEEPTIKKNKPEEDNEIPRVAFNRLVKEILKEYTKGKIKHIQQEAINILQIASEKHIISNFKMFGLARDFRDAKTIQQRDMVFCRRIIEINNKGCI
uniref:Histone domain-containing protein n=1 Tax=Parastrongyloides trichosuri TaxID=131310 RepID=A0A0N4ZYH5_PARTI